VAEHAPRGRGSREVCRMVGWILWTRGWSRLDPRASPHVSSSAEQLQPFLAPSSFRPAPSPSAAPSGMPVLRPMCVPGCGLLVGCCPPLAPLVINGLPRPRIGNASGHAPAAAEASEASRDVAEKSLGVCHGPLNQRPRGRRVHSKAQQPIYESRCLPSRGRVPPSRPTYSPCPDVRHGGQGGGVGAGVVPCRTPSVDFRGVLRCQGPMRAFFRAPTVLHPRVCSVHLPVPRCAASQALPPGSCWCWRP
jgi:hypothetical protein